MIYDQTSFEPWSIMWIHFVKIFSSVAWASLYTSVISFILKIIVKAQHQLPLRCIATKNSILGGSIIISISLLAMCSNMRSDRFILLEECHPLMKRDVSSHYHLDLVAWGSPIPLMPSIIDPQSTARIKAAYVIHGWSNSCISSRLNN